MVIQRREKVVDGKAKYQSFDVETHPKKKKVKTLFLHLGKASTCRSCGFSKA